MPSKARRTKSLESFQHEENKKSHWESDAEDEDDKKNDPDLNKPIITLPDGITVRPIRRTDAAALHECLNDPTIARCFPDTVYPQPFSLWLTHSFIAKKFDKDKCFRRQHLSSSTSGSEPTAAASDDDLYEQAVRALADLQLENRLKKINLLKSSTDTASKSSAAPAKDKGPLLPVYYAIAHDDILIGMVDIGFEEVLTPDDDKNESNQKPSSAGFMHENETIEAADDPGFMHEAEICYWISSKYRGRGIMTSVLRHFLDWSWHNFAQLERIGAAVYTTWNPASTKVLKKLDFFEEGMWEGAIRKNGRFGDIGQYCINRPGGKVEQMLIARAREESHT